MLYSFIVPALMQLYCQQGYLLSISKYDIILSSTIYVGVRIMWSAVFIEYLVSNLLPVFLGFCFV